MKLSLCLSCCHVQRFGDNIACSFFAPFSKILVVLVHASFGDILHAPFPNSFGCTSPCNFTYLKSNIFRQLKYQDSEDA